MKFKLIHAFMAIGAMLVVFSLSQTFKTNNNGYRTVVEWPNGHTFIRMSPGWYPAMFGKTTRYQDLMEYHLDDLNGLSKNDGVVHGISVRYQDGGTGTVDGVVRVALPQDPQAMLKLHRAFRSEAGVKETLLIPEIRQSLNLTAGLMTSEEAYAERRSDYANWATDQIQNGRYETKLVFREIQGIDGNVQKKRVPVQETKEDGSYIYQSSPLHEYGLTVTGFQVTDWGFEQKTLDQISTKREAEMKAIALEAQARQAISEQTQIIAQGKAEVERIRYQELQKKERALIEAEREKEVAVIAAEREKERNAELLEAAKIDVQTAAEQKRAVQLRADGEAYAKQKVIEADGALQQKLDAYVKTNEYWADAYAKRNVPSLLMGGTDGTGGDTDAAQFQQMLNALIGKDLMLNAEVTK